MTITLKTLPQATEQEIFDQVKNHLLTQNKASMREGGTCVYRGPNGLKCAAGCLIGDDEYLPEMDRAYGTTWLALAGRGLVPQEHKDFIIELQNVHDDWSPSSWPDKLNKLAGKKGLRY